MNLLKSYDCASMVKAEPAIRQLLKLDNDISNLQVLCSRCSQKKKHHFDSRFQRHYE